MGLAQLILRSKQTISTEVAQTARGLASLPQALPLPATHTTYV